MLSRAGNRDSRISAVVLAAGYSSRMGALKPALRFGGDSAIDLCVGAFICSGVTDIVLVTGHRSGEVLDALYFRDIVRTAHNARFGLGMFSSVQAGVAALPEGCGAFLLSPADYPRIAPDTAAVLIRAFEASGADVVYPQYESGRAGHPCLISAALIPEILAEPASSNLREVLERHGGRSLRAAVQDAGVTMDMDTRDDYERLLASAGRRWDRESALALAGRELPPAELDAARKRAACALRIAGEYNGGGAALDPELAYTAALLYRIRPEPEEAERFLFSLGLPKHGLIAGGRLTQGAPDAPPSERTVVALADAQ